MPGETPDEDLELDDGALEEGQGEDGNEVSLDEESPEGDERESGDASEDDEEEGRPQQVAGKSHRGANRFSTLRNENRQLAEQLARQERMIEDLRTTTQQRHTQPDPELEAQRLSLMSPEERLEYRFDQSQKQHARELAAVRVQVADQADRATFEATLAGAPNLQKYRSQVEQLYVQQLRAGQHTDRNVILSYILGESVRKRLSGDTGKQRKQAQTRINRQQTRPGDSRNDMQGQRGRREKSLEDRLADVFI